MKSKIQLAFILLFLLSFNKIKAQDIALDLGGEIAGKDASEYIKGSSDAYFKLIVTNNGPGTLPRYKIRPQISLPTGKVTFSTNPADHVIPVGWTILSNNGQTITLSNGTDQLADGDGHIILLKINPITEGSYISVANLLFSNGDAPGSSNGPQLAGDDGSNQGLPFAYSVIKKSSPLPVTLVSFTAKAENTTAELNWSTTRETNSDRFEIQHSIDAKLWSMIGNVASNGESKVKRDYFYVHQKPATGSNYYRLKMIDNDLSFAFSAIRNVSFENLVIKLYPNPVTDKLSLELADWSKVKSVQIYSLNGTSVYESGKNPNNEISVKHLSAGLHFVLIQSSDGSSTRVKFVVAK